MIYRSKLVELKTPLNTARGDQYNFANDADLQNCYIVGITTLNAENLTLAPSGAPVVAQLNGLTITIVEEAQKSRRRDVPLTDLDSSNQGGFIRFNYPFKLNWQDSYITVYDPATFTPGDAIVVEVYYIPDNEIGTYEKLYSQYGQ